MINPNEVFSLIGLKKHLLDGKDINDFDVKNIDNKTEKKALPKQSKLLGKWAAYNICKPVRRPKLRLNTETQGNLSYNFLEAQQDTKPQLESTVLEQAKIISKFADNQEPDEKNDFFVGSATEVVIKCTLVIRRDMRCLVRRISETNHILLTPKVVHFSNYPTECFLTHSLSHALKIQCDFEKYFYESYIEKYFTFTALLKERIVFLIKEYNFVIDLKQWYLLFLNFKNYYREKPFT